MPNKKALLKNKGRLWVLDELAATKAFVEIALIDSVDVKHPVNTTEIKTPSGITVMKTTEPGASISFDLYHPGDLSVIERLFRGIVEKTTYTGSAAQVETVIINFRNVGDCAVLPGYNGAKTAATITSIKSLDLATTYTVSTDYTVTADALTGMTLITHVSPASTIPLNTDVVVTYSYTPLKSTVLKPNYDGNIIERFLVVDSYPDKSDATKYRRYFLPKATVMSDMVHSLLEVGKENSKPNILPVTLELATPDIGMNEPVWYWIDTYNV